MLQLAAAAFAEMAADGLGAVRARNQRPVGRDPVTGHAARDMAPVRRYAVAARSDAFDQSSIGHAFNRSSATRPGPIARARDLCQPTAATAADRKSDVSGKRDRVGVDSGGGRTFKKNMQKKPQNTS